MKIYNVHIVKH